MALLASIGALIGRGMRAVLGVVPRFGGFLRGDPLADRAVPPSGFPATLTLLTAAAMAFLAVFALALSLASGRLADRWSEGLAGTVTLRLPPEAEAGEVQAALTILGQTPGVTASHALTADENRALLEPWLGPDLPVEALPIPQLIEVTVGDEFDAEGLRARLEGEMPDATLDDHTRWRQPLVAAAGRLRALGWTAMALIAGVTGAMIWLAAQGALAANAQVIRVLRLVGATDAYIARAFVRRFTLRAAWGAAGGTLLGVAAVMLLPDADAAGTFLTGLAFQGAGWFLPVVIPPLAGLAAYAATRAAALRTLRAEP